MRFLFLALGGLSSCATAPAPQQAADPEWRTFGRDDENSRHNRAERTISRENVSKLVPRWRVENLPAVTSTPVVADGVVYFADWGGFLHAVSAADGKTVWREQVATKSVTSSLLVAGEAVYASDAAGFLHARERATGKKLWSVQLENHDSVHLFSSPVWADGRIVLGISGFELMKFKKDFTFRGSVVAVEPATGKELWRVYTTKNDETAGAGVSVWSSAAVDRKWKTIYIGTGNTYEPPPSPMADGILALRYETGETAWMHSFTKDDVWNVKLKTTRGQDADVGGAPNLFAIDGRDVVGVGDKAGRYHVLDRENGAKVWSVPLTEASHLGGVMVAAAAGDGAIYVCSNVFTDDMSIGNPKNTSVTFALDMRTGGVLWKRPIPAPVFGAVALANGVVYHGATDGMAYALDAKTGEKLWSDKPGGDIAGGFSVSNGTLFVSHGYWFLFPDPRKPKGGLVAYAIP